MQQQPPRRFSTAARVYPTVLPHLSRTPTVPVRGIASVAAVAAVGYGAAKLYIDKTNEAAAAQQLQYNAREDERRQRNEELMEMYSGRSSLEELEQAVKFYEQRK